MACAVSKGLARTDAREEEVGLVERAQALGAPDDGHRCLCSVELPVNSARGRTGVSALRQKSERVGAGSTHRYCAVRFLRASTIMPGWIVAHLDWGGERVGQHLVLRRIWQSAEAAHSWNAGGRSPAAFCFGSTWCS